MSTKRTLLVTGAAGNLGRQVVEQLLATNAGPIIATTRTPRSSRISRSAASRFAQADFS